jgi:hypothetical protein
MSGTGVDAAQTVTASFGGTSTPAPEFGATFAAHAGRNVPDRRDVP